MVIHKSSNIPIEPALPDEDPNVRIEMESQTPLMRSSSLEKLATKKEKIYNTALILSVQFRRRDQLV